MPERNEKKEAPGKESELKGELPISARNNNETRERLFGEQAEDPKLLNE